ncbi:MAG TPA: YggS family pyridoxal phosphate-dependent enzyme, partial [Candidatus Eisenbacteria bacterium]
VRARIQAAARASWRDPEAITLVAVSKTFPAEDVIEAVVDAIDAGLAHFGKNKVQEAEAKIPIVASARTARPEWQLIGHLQSNKAGKAVELFDLIHSIDSTSLAQAVARRAGMIGKRQRVLLQVNCSGEAQKSGCEPDDAADVARAIAGHTELALEGLMTIGPLDDDPGSARPAFRQLRELRDRISAQLGLPLPHLSMGMTGDLEVAIAEGATIVRVGSALFGQRPAPGAAGKT